MSAGILEENRVEFGEIMIYGNVVNMLSVLGLMRCEYDRS